MKIPGKGVQVNVISSSLLSKRGSEGGDGTSVDDVLLDEKEEPKVKLEQL